MRVLAIYGRKLFVACGSFVLGYNFVDNSVNEYGFDEPKDYELTVLTIRVSDGGKYLFAGYSSKHVCCWDVATGKLLGSTVCKKRPTGIVFSSLSESHEAVLVADKTGDIWGYDVPLFKSQIILAGHTASIITDLDLFGELVVSSDRDEKVRVSRFPDLETIVSYCLGHSSVVSSVAFLSVANQPLLVSASWDHRMCLWNPQNGHQFALKAYPDSRSKDTKNVEETENNIDNVASDVQQQGVGEDDDEEELEEEKTYDERLAGNFPFKVTTFGSTVAVIFRNLTTIHLYEVQSVNDGFDFVYETEITLQAVPSDIIFMDKQLIALLPNPYYMQIFDVTFNTDAKAFQVQDQTAGENKVNVETFVQKCSELGANFSQVSADQLDEEKNLKKHELDKPFDKLKNIDYNKKKGAKRSKRE